MAVRITTSPIDPRIHPKTPEMEKALIINTIPAIKRKITSPFSTFFVFTAGFPSCTLNSNCLHLRVFSSSCFSASASPYQLVQQSLFSDSAIRLQLIACWSSLSAYCLLPTAYRFYFLRVTPSPHLLVTLSRYPSLEMRTFSTRFRQLQKTDSAFLPLISKKGYVPILDLSSRFSPKSICNSHLESFYTDFPVS
jgi:hypothetical protein